MSARDLLCQLLKTAALRPDVELQEHQKRVVEKAKALPQDAGLLVYHGLGSGKTIGAIAAADALGGRSQAIVPAALRENYRKELDKAHRIGHEGTAASQLANLPGRKLLLSGSPIRSDPSELTPLLQAIAPDRDVPRSADEFNRRFVQPAHKNNWFARMFGAEAVEPETVQNLDGLRSLLRGRVDYHASEGEFPETDNEDVEVEMSDEQTSLYRMLTKKNPGLMDKLRHSLPVDKADSKQLNAFLSAVRQVSNTPTSFGGEGDPVDASPKLKRMLDEVIAHNKRDPNYRGLTYSNYLGSGVDPLAKRLNDSGVPAGVFSGKLNDAERKALVESYNTGKLKQLLVTRAGAEGLDLKGTKLVQLMEPHWNEARSNQVVGRAVRHQSHANLPEAERKVKIQRFFARPQPTLLQQLGIGDPDRGTDRYLEDYARRKQELIDRFLNVLKQEGSAPVK